MLKRVLVLLLLLSCLAVPLAAAPAPRGEAVQERRAPGVLQALPTPWEALTFLFSRLKAHGTMDPNGVTAPEPPGSESGTDAHGTMDPDG
jgi:hypothetical protein